MSQHETILICVPELFIIRNILRTAFVDMLRKDRPLSRIIFAAPPALVESLTKEFASQGIIIVPLQRGPRSLLDGALGFLGRNGLYTGTNDVMQRRAWESGQSSIPPLCKRVLGHVLGNAWLLRSLLRACEGYVPRHDSVRALFDTYAPTIVFSTVLTDTDVDAQILREAKARRIPTVGMVRSWDNLTGFGYLRQLPDYFFAQSEYIAETAVLLHDIPRSRITVTGLPHYDFYTDVSLRGSREALCAKLGLNPEKKIILYGAIGEFLFPHEADMGRIIGRVAEELGAQAIFRPHPAFPMHERLSTTATVTLDDQDLSSLPHLIESLAHADVVVTTGSTLMVDASCFDTPVVTVAFDGERIASNPWLSVARFYDYFTHIVRLINRTRGVRVVRSERELTEAVRAYLADPALDGAGRAAIVEHFASPLGGAGQRLAQALIATASR